MHRNTYPAAEVRYANEELEKLTGFTSGISRTALLSCMAATEAMHHAGIPTQHSFRIGFVSANSVEGGEVWISPKIFTKLFMMILQKEILNR